MSTIIQLGSKRSHVPREDFASIVAGLTAPAEIILGPGTYYGPGGSGTPLTPLVVPSTAYGTVIRGYAAGAGTGVTMASPILCESGRIGFENMHINPIGGDYGVTIKKLPNFISRCWMRNVSIGGIQKSDAVAGNAPRDGLILDGAGVFLAEKVTIAFNRRHGLVADATPGGAPANQPNTTLKFDMCSFVQNGFGPAETVGVGIKLEGSLSIAEFNGGNSEGNMFKEATGANMNNTRFRDFDFETSTVMTECVQFGACNPVTFDNCNFITAIQGGGDPSPGSPFAAKAMSFATCVGVRVHPNRYSGWTNAGIIRLDENCQNCWVDPLILAFDAGNCWVEDYSR